MQFGDVSNRKIVRERLRCRGVAVRGRRGAPPLIYARSVVRLLPFCGGVLVRWHGHIPPLYSIYIIRSIYTIPYIPIYIFIILYIILCAIVPI